MPIFSLFNRNKKNTVHQTEEDITQALMANNGDVVLPHEDDVLKWQRLKAVAQEASDPLFI